MSKKQISLVGIFFGVFLVISLCVTPKTLAYWNLNTTGKLEFVDSKVLGDSQDQPEVHNQETEKQENQQSQRSGDNQNNQEKAKENAQRQAEQTREAQKQQLEVVRENLKQQVEVRREAQKKMNEVLKNNNGQLKKDDKLEFEHKSGGLDMKVRSVDGVEKNVGTQDKFTFEDLKDKEEVSIATEDGHLKLSKGGVEATTDLKLQLSPNNNSLELSLPDGTKKGISVLPDQAVESVAPKATESAKVELGVVENEPTYTVETDVNKKLFGIVPVILKQRSSVSAVSGVSKPVPDSFYEGLLKLLSF